MIKENKKTPEIRFPGFTEDWEQRKLGEIGFAKSGVGFPDSEQGGTEGIPFYKVSDMNIQGNENELASANNYVSEEQIARKKWKVIDDVPAIFFAKVGAAVMLNRKRLVRFPFLLDNNTMAYVFDKNVWDCDFGKTLFETIDLTQLAQTGALPSYNTSDVEGIEITLPETDEQKKIGEYFASLDNLITLHQRKCDALKTLKKSMLQKMFPKKGSSVPEIRFPSFTEDWEQRKLGDVIAELKSGLSRQLDNADIGLPVVRANNINDGKLDMENDVKYWYKNDPQGADTSNYLIHKNDILINFINSEAKMGTATIVDNEPARDTIYTTNILKMKADDTASDSLFLLYLTMTSHYCNYIKSITKPAVNQASFTTVDYKNYSFLIPSLEEQKRIGEYFSQLDNLITLHQRKCDTLKELKKGMLQKMFV